MSLLIYSFIWYKTFMEIAQKEHCLVFTFFMLSQNKLFCLSLYFFLLPLFPLLHTKVQLSLFCFIFILLCKTSCYISNSCAKATSFFSLNACHQSKHVNYASMIYIIHKHTILHHILIDFINILLGNFSLLLFSFEYEFLHKSCERYLI